ncbi:SH3 domain-containing protein [Microcoleus sp. FACHB-672]|uniref:SH3 domain-containing protein n=1 Tax=Microcoleus sp. FACHB-672 TaxID=2692825 RepID=UPI00168765BA|nr:SH3 domain-containing protein [Microcoleus sp. FACHB-672]MBD2039475.1 SH3 domain-containing protein [Microcoleus sp. FACHB-672]
MKTKSSLLLILAVLASSLAIALPAKAICKVTDPTGTPLNVRDRPSGEVINTLRNGWIVYIEDSATDDQGRPWVKVGSYSEEGYDSWGWVIREFISCYKT